LEDLEATPDEGCLDGQDMAESSSSLYDTVLSREEAS
jgi:hypothetical protein